MIVYKQYVLILVKLDTCGQISQHLSDHIKFHSKFHSIGIGK